MRVLAGRDDGVLQAGEAPGRATELGEVALQFGAGLADEVGGLDARGEALGEAAEVPALPLAAADPADGDGELLEGRVDGVEVGALRIVPVLDALGFGHLAEAMRGGAEEAGRLLERAHRQALGLPVTGGQRPVFPLRPGLEDGTGRHGVGDLRAGGHEGLGRQFDPEGAGEGDDRFADDEDAAGRHALDEPELGAEITLELAMAIEVVLVEVGPEHGLGREVAQVLRLEGADLDDREEGSVRDGRVQGRERQADVPAGDGVLAGALMGEGQELGQGGLAVRPGDGDGRPGPEQRAKVELRQALQAGAPGGEQPGMGLRETRAVDHEVVTGGLVGTERGVAALGIVDHRGEARGAQGVGHGAPADARAQDGGRARQAALEAVGEVAHRSLRDSRPRSPNRKERIQKRATTLVEAQPFFWKWWWIGVIRNRRRPPVRLK